MLEFDQSAFYMNSGDFYNTVYIAAEQISDQSLSETDVTIISTPTSSNIDSRHLQLSQLQSIAGRVHTPARVYNSPDQPKNYVYFTNDV